MNLAFRRQSCCGRCRSLSSDRSWTRARQHPQTRVFGISAGFRQMRLGENNSFAGNGLGNIAFSPDGTGSTNSRVSGESQPRRAVRRRGEAGDQEKGPARPRLLAVAGTGDAGRRTPEPFPMVTVSLLLRLFTRPFPSVVNREGPVAKESGLLWSLAVPALGRAAGRTRPGKTVWKMDRSQ